MKMPRSLNLNDFLNVLDSNSKHLDVLNFPNFATLCKRIHEILITTFAFNMDIFETKGLYTYCILVKFLILY